VSVDSKFSLRAYAEKEGYGFDLLADFWPHGAVASTYGVFDPEIGMAVAAPSSSMRWEPSAMLW